MVNPGGRGAMSSTKFAKVCHRTQTRTPAPPYRGYDPFEGW